MYAKKNSSINIFGKEKQNSFIHWSETRQKFSQARKFCVNISIIYHDVGGNNDFVMVIM